MFHARDQSTQLTAEPMKTAYVRADSAAPSYLSGRIVRANCQGEGARRMGMVPGCPGDLFRRTVPAAVPALVPLSCSRDSGKSASAPRRPREAFNIRPGPPAPASTPVAEDPSRRGTTINTRVPPVPKGPLGPCGPAGHYRPFHPRRMRSAPASRQTMDMPFDAPLLGGDPSWERSPQMSRPHAITVGSIALATAFVLLTGCSPTSPPAATPSPTAAISSPPASVSEICAAADAHAGALANFKATLKPDATIEQVRAAQDQVSKTYEELAKASENLAQQRAE